jgi:hypothetical protein
MSRQTFRAVGIPFPLFDAPASEAREYIGVSRCSLCGRERHCFDLSLAGEVVKVTELGMIRHEHATRGVTLGVPGQSRRDFELVPFSDGWAGAKLPLPTMLELLRTPGYLTIQGANWLFCCKAPMVYVGQWSREKFSAMAPDGNGREFFKQVVRDPIEGLWEDKLHDETGIYVFSCPTCKKYSAHWDLF